jgi:hypothetical protein
MDKLKVYLAGGMNSNWQAKVIEHFGEQFIFYNPVDHCLNKSKEYTAWDLFYVSKADLVFAFMEETNLSGYGLTLEIGYAKGLGKNIILIDEKSKLDKAFGERFKIVRDSSTIVYDSLQQGIEFLGSFLRTNKSNVYAFS